MKGELLIVAILGISIGSLIVLLINLAIARQIRDRDRILKTEEDRESK